MKPERLTSGQARRIALAAQGFRRDRPGRSGARHLERMFERLGLVQIDSVNVLARAHYVPFYSRSGAYDAALLDRAAYGKRRALFEYWGHEASLLRLDLYPLMRWRMERAARSEGIYGGARALRGRAAPLHRCRAARGRGPRPADGPGTRRGRARARRAGGAGATASARSNGCSGAGASPRRRAAASSASTISPSASCPTASSRRRPSRSPTRSAPLIMVAARALGVATERDLRDYFRLAPADARPAHRRARRGRPAEAGGGRGLGRAGLSRPGGPPAAQSRGARPRCRRSIRCCGSAAAPSACSACATASRSTRRLHKREFGYYVLPFLLGDRLVARLDLKADRVARRLLVHAVHLEPWSSPDEAIPALREELRSLADWLGLDDVVVTARSGAAALLAK